MPKITDVIKHIMILNVILFVLTNTPVNQYLPDLALYFPKLEQFRPYQILSHMFMHAGLQHLFMNMLGLFFLGPMVESRLGAKKFFILYFACGFGAVALRFLMQHLGFVSIMNPAVGASGAVIGVTTAFATLFPNQKLYLMFVPIPIKAKYLMLGLIAFDLYGGFVGIGSNIAHFAHLGGALTGFLLTYFVLNKFEYTR